MDWFKCKNCVRWGLPWRLNRKMVLCSKRKDFHGIAFHPEHLGCKFFTPKQTKLPRALQLLRLLTQSLDEEQLIYLRHVANQACEILLVEDKYKNKLALGDIVKFNLENKDYVGSIEGVEGAYVCVFSDAFPNSNVLVLSSDAIKITKEEVKDSILKVLDSGVQDSLKSYIKQLLHDIAELRVRKLSPYERGELFAKELDYATLNSILKYEVVLEKLLED